MYFILGRFFLYTLFIVENELLDIQLLVKFNIYWCFQQIVFVVQCNHVNEEVFRLDLNMDSWFLNTDIMDD